MTTDNNSARQQRIDRIRSNVIELTLRYKNSEISNIDESIVFFNSYADYYRYVIGVNVIPANTKNKLVTIEWKDYQSEPIPESLHEGWKKKGLYSQGIELIPGKVWHRLDRANFFYTSLDIDKRLGIEELTTYNGKKTSLAAFATKFIVEQHLDDLDKAHLGFYSPFAFPNKGPDSVTGIEVKGLGEHGIMFSSPSMHQDGSRYEITGTFEPIILTNSQAQQLLQHLNEICRRHGISYLEKTSTLNENLRRVIKNIKIEYNSINIVAGQRHKTLIAFADSLLFKHYPSKGENVLKEFFTSVNETLCHPPMPEKEVNSIWNSALDFVLRHKENHNREGENHNAEGKGSFHEDNLIPILTVKIDYDDRNNNPETTFIELHADSIRQVIKREVVVDACKTAKFRITRITDRAPIVDRIVTVDGKEYLYVKYGKDNFFGNVKEIMEQVWTTGGVAAPQNLFKSAISTILEHQRRLPNVKHETLFPCVGIFEYRGKLIIAHPDFNPILDSSRKENIEALKVLEQVKSRHLPASGCDIKTLTSAYLRIPAYFSCLEAVVPMCYSIMQPFIFVLKRHLPDYFCQMLLTSSGTKLGKSAIGNTITEDLYGIRRKALSSIDSVYRMLQTLNATTLPQHISEIQTFEFESFADVIKASAESIEIGDRYNANQTQNKFYGKSSLIYSSNGYKASEPSLLHRFLIIPYVEEEREKRARDMPIFNKTIRQEIKKFPLGYNILNQIIAKYGTARAMVSEINTIVSKITFNCKSEGEDKTNNHTVYFADERRILSYALVYLGLQCWRDFIFLQFPKLSDKTKYGKYWFHRYFDIPIFIEEVIRPLENIVMEADEQSPASNFVAWLESYVSNQGEREEGVTWMYSSDRSSIFITKSILQSYKVHCSRASTTAFQSLEQVAKSITADLKMSVGVYPTRVGRAVVTDGYGKIIKEARPYIEKKVVRVPIGIIQKTLLNNVDV